MEAIKRDEILAKEAEHEKKMRRRMEREELCQKQKKRKKWGLNGDADHLNPVFSFSIPDDALHVSSSNEFFLSRSASLARIPFLYVASIFQAVSLTPSPGKPPQHLC